ncbi:LacI family DNA-binding transcriptional regulator [Microlunatus parietis]|uniref:DNA-binding LacI/PurR family transcriptional regulator n=1 Tax=Microlunatus parietis TaxID=682979 RepID=A0A7Y9IC62_9ACTN|nr:LacI family DNA-binding transcriptional regulator [Microlunatus parietis]NYE74216.1 DNA-binding LacI/PurR family transcriptional regulator [Microlunatus parietis]
MVERHVTLKDVAKRAGVSTAVVSAAISGNATTIRMSEATRLRVERAVAETGYRVNHAAKSLRMSRSGIIAAVVPKIANPVFEYAIRGIQAAAEEAGDVLMLTDALWIKHGSHLMQRMVGTRMVDGFLVRSPQLGSETIEELTSRTIPYVILQTPAEDDQRTSVWVDDHAGIALATEHLLRLGHRRIALIGGPDQASYGGPRVAGYLDTLRSAGLRPDPRLVHRSGFDPHVVAQSAMAVLTGPEPPTAMIIDNVIAAPGALAAIVDLGLRVPEDLSVVAYQDLPIAGVLRPAPTTIRMPVYEAGVRGYRALRQLIDGKRARSALVKSPRPKLIDRGSTAPPAS